jgi:hypothetical protein
MAEAGEEIQQNLVNYAPTLGKVGRTKTTIIWNKTPLE